MECHLILVKVVTKANALQIIKTSANKQTKNIKNNYDKL